MQAEKRQKEFITNAGHELKTPLSIIKANTELQELMNGKSEWTTSNEQQVDRLTRLINNLISLARMEEQPKVTLTTIDASATFKRATDSFKAIIMQEDKTFKVKVMPGLKIRLMRTVSTSYVTFFSTTLTNIVMTKEPLPHI